MSLILQVTAVALYVYFNIRRIRERNKLADHLAKAGRETTTNYYFQE